MVYVFELFDCCQCDVPKLKAFQQRIGNLPKIKVVWFKMYILVLTLLWYILVLFKKMSHLGVLDLCEEGQIQRRLVHVKYISRLWCRILNSLSLSLSLSLSPHLPLSSINATKLVSYYMLLLIILIHLTTVGGTSTIKQSCRSRSDSCDGTLRVRYQ